MDYKILSVRASGFLGTDFEQAAQDLATQVRMAMREGWEPTGGVAVGTTQSTHEPHLFQALVKQDVE